MSSGNNWHTSNPTRARKEYLFQRDPIGQQMHKCVDGIVDALEVHDENIGGGVINFTLIGSWRMYLRDGILP